MYIYYFFIASTVEFLPVSTTRDTERTWVLNGIFQFSNPGVFLRIEVVGAKMYGMFKSKRWSCIFGFPLKSGICKCPLPSKQTKYGIFVMQSWKWEDRIPKRKFCFRVLSIVFWCMSRFWWNWRRAINWKDWPKRDTLQNGWHCFSFVLSRTNVAREHSAAYWRGYGVKTLPPHKQSHHLHVRTWSCGTCK